MKTIFGLFENHQAARAAIEDLLARKFDEKEMSLVGSDAVAGNSKSGGPEGMEARLTERQAIKIAELGDVYAIGDLARVLAETTSDSAGNVQAALRNFDLSEENIRAYKAGVRAGGLLFFMRAFDNRTAEAVEILQQHGVRHVSNQTPLQQ